MSAQRSPNKLPGCYAETVPYERERVCTGFAALPAQRRYPMKGTFPTDPHTAELVTAWTVSDSYGPYFFFNPDRTRCWGYFTKAVARDVARTVGGWYDPACGKAIKQVVVTLPAGVTYGPGQ